MTTRRADVYACEKGHEFAIIHREDRGEEVEDTLPCPYHKELAHYRGSFHLELNLTEKLKAEGWK